MIYQMEEWQGSSGRWYCEHIKSFPRNVQKWVVPARILGISADEYVKLLIFKYKPDHISFDGNTLVYSWNSQQKMRVFKNYMNAMARKANFEI